MVLPESLIDSQFAALDVSIDIDQPVDVIVSTIIRELNSPTQ